MNQEGLNNELNSNVAPQPEQPTYTVPTEPVQPYTAPVEPVQPVAPTEPVAAPTIPVETQESMEKISNLNKEDAMEEALSHTNQYPPFEVQQEEVNQEVSMMSNKKALVFLGFILGIMLLFIIFLPQISKMIG